MITSNSQKTPLAKKESQLLSLTNNNVLNENRTQTSPSNIREKMIFDLEDKYNNYVKKVQAVIDELLKNDFFRDMKGNIDKGQALEVNNSSYITYDGETVLKNLRNLIHDIIQMMKNYEEKTSQIVIPVPKNSLDFETILEKMKAELKVYIKNEEKYKLHIEISKMKLGEYERDIFACEENYRRLKQQYEKDIGSLKDQIKILTGKIKYFREDNVSLKASFSKEHSVDAKLHVPSENKVIHGSTKDSIIQFAKTCVGQEKFKEVKSEIEKNRFFTTKSKDELKTLKRLTDVADIKEMNEKQTETLICRLKIQVQEKERELLKLNKDYNILFNEMKDLKEKKIEEEKAKWAKEAVSDKNQNLIEYYKEKLAKKESIIQDLEKKLRKYAIAEKKIFVKEKAFELERADYLERLTYLHDRVQKLHKNNEILTKTQQLPVGIPFEQMRRYVMGEANKSTHSSVDSARGGITPFHGGDGISANETIKPDVGGKKNGFTRMQTAKPKLGRA